MKNLFPYLSTKNISRLFAKQKTTLDVEDVTAPKISAGRMGEEVQEVPFILQEADRDVIEQVGLLTMESLRTPCCFVCDLKGQILWEEALRAFDLEPIRDDIIRHLQLADSDDVAGIAKMVPYPKDVKTDPQDGVARFACLTVLRSCGKIVGALCVVDDNERRLTSTFRKRLTNAATLLTNCLSQHAREIEHSLISTQVAEIRQLMQKKAGGAFLGLLCKGIAEVLQVDWCFVAERSLDKKDNTKTLAVAYQGASVANLEFPVANSPFAGIMSGKFVVHPDGVSSDYKANTMLAESKAQGFAGISVLNTDGKIAGYLIIMDAKPLVHVSVIQAVLQSAAARVAAEVQSAAIDRVAQHDITVSKAQFDAFFNSEAVSCCTTSQKGFFKRMNQTLLDRLGYRWGELRMKRYTDITVVEDQEAEAKLRMECEQGKREGYELEKRFVTKSGEEFWGRVSVSVVPGAEQDTMLYLEIIEDFTELKVAKDELTKSEAAQFESSRCFEAIKQSSRIPLISLNTKGLIIDSNEAFQKMLGYNGTQLQDMRFTMLLGLSQDEQLPDLERCLSGKNIQQQLDYDVDHKNGQTKTLSFSLNAVVDADGDVQQVLVTAQDLTNLQTVQDSLNAMARKFDALVQESSVAVGMLDGKWQFESTNTAFENLIARSESEMKKRTVVDIVAEPDRQPWNEQLKQCVHSSMTMTEMPLSIIRGDGQEVPVHMTVSLVRENDMVVHGVVTLEDQSRLSDLDLELGRNQAASTALLDTVPAGIFSLDANGYFIDANEPFRQMVDLTQEQVQQKSLADLLEQEDLEKSGLAGFFKEGLEGDRDRYQCECHFIKSETERADVSLTLSVVRDREGLFLQFLGSTEDLTHLKNYEEQTGVLRHYKEIEFGKLRSVLQTNPAGILVADAEGQVVHANDLALSWLSRNQANAEEKDALTKLLQDDKGYLQDCMAGKRRQVQWEKQVSKKWLRHTVTACAEQGHTFWVATLEDITELKAAQAALEVSESSVQDTLSLRPTGVCFLDADGTLTRVNKGLCQILDLSEEEAQARKFTEIFGGADEAELKSKFKNAVRSIGAFEFSTQIHKKAVPQTVRLSVKAIQGKDQNLQYLVAIIEDETEVAEVREKLHKVRSEIEQIFANPGVMLGLSDEKGSLIQANNSFLEFFGYNQEELRFKAWEDLGYEDDKEAYVENLQLCREGKLTDYQVEKRFQTKSGGLFWGRLTLSVADAQDGSGHLMAGTIEDISRRKELESTLRAHEARFDAVFDKTSLGLAVVDASGLLLKVNPQLAVLLGEAVENLQGKHLEDLVDAERKEEARSLAVECAEGSRSVFGLEAQLQRDTAQLPARLTVSKIEQSDYPQWAMILMVEDLTERKELERTTVLLTEAKEQMGGLEDEIQNTRSELETTAQNLADIETRLQEVQEQTEGLNGQLQQTQQELSNETARAGDLESNLQETHSELETTSVRLDEADQELAQLRQTVTDVEESLRNEKARAELAESERDELKQQLAGQQEELQGHEVRISNTAADLKSAQMRIVEIEKKEIEKDALLKKAEEAKLAMLDEAKIAVVQLDKYGEVLKVNPVFTEWTGFDVASLQDVPLSETLSLINDVNEKEQRDACFNGEQNAYVMEGWMACKDATAIWVRIYGHIMDASPEKRLVWIIDNLNVIPQLESQHAESDSRFKALVSSSMSGVVITSADGKVNLVNDTMIQWSGEPEGEWIGRKFTEFVYTENKDEGEELEKMLVDGSRDAFTLESVLKDSQGRKLQVLMDAQAIRNHDGSLWNVLRSFSNKSKSTEMHLHLQIIETRFQTLFSSNKRPTAMVDNMGNIIASNTAFIELLGYEDPDQLRGRKLMDLAVMSELADLLDSFISRMISRKSIKARVRDEFKKKDESKIMATLSIYGVYTVEHQLDSAIVFMDQADCSAMRQKIEEAKPAQPVQTDKEEEDEDSLKHKTVPILVLEKETLGTTILPKVLTRETSLPTNQDTDKSSVVISNDKMSPEDSETEKVKPVEAKAEQISTEKKKAEPDSQAKQQTETPSTAKSQQQKEETGKTETSEEVTKSKPQATPEVPEEDKAADAKKTEDELSVSSADDTGKVKEVKKASRTTLKPASVRREEAMKIRKVVERSMAPHIEEAFITTDDNGKVVMLNEAAEKIIDLKFEQAYGHEITEVYNIHQQQQIHLLGDNSGLILMQTELRTAGAKQLHVKQSNSPLMDPEGSLVGTAILFRESASLERLGKDTLKKGGIQSMDELDGFVALLFRRKLEALCSTTMSQLPDIHHKIHTEGKDAAREQVKDLICVVEERLSAIE
ncbi:MAG: PAS domain S-box protein [Verrucomicrobiota bacterium]